MRASSARDDISIAKLPGPGDTPGTLLAVRSGQALQELVSPSSAGHVVRLAVGHGPEALGWILGVFKIHLQGLRYRHLSPLEWSP